MLDIEGIILAAGFSSRANAYKMTLEFKNSTIIEHTISSMLTVCRRIVLVGGYKIEKLYPVANKYREVELVFNESYEAGMFASILKGVGCIQSRDFFYTPGDYPLIEPDVYKGLLKHEGKIVIPTHRGRRGHPVLFRGEDMKKGILSGSYENLRDFIGDNSPEFVESDCSGILQDIDTMEDYEDIIRTTRG